MLVENRDFYSHTAFDAPPPLGGIRRNIANRFGL